MWVRGFFISQMSCTESVDNNNEGSDRAIESHRLGQVDLSHRLLAHVKLRPMTSDLFLSLLMLIEHGV